MAPYKPSDELVLAQKTTLARLQSISNHFKDTKGSNRLKDKVIIVTGVGSLKGIGRATARVFAREGKYNRLIETCFNSNFFILTFS